MNLTATEVQELERRYFANGPAPDTSYLEPLIDKMLEIALTTNEKDPHGKAAGEPGAKLDAGKSPVYRGAIEYFPRALMAVANVSAYGANKYSWKGWEKVPDGINRYKDALGRHITKEGIEGPWDLEIKNDPKYPGEIRHLAQVAWNALAALELTLREEGK